MWQSCKFNHVLSSTHLTCFNIINHPRASIGFICTYICISILSVCNFPFHLLPACFIPHPRAEQENVIPQLQAYLPPTHVPFTDVIRSLRRLIHCEVYLRFLWLPITLHLNSPMNRRQTMAGSKLGPMIIYHCTFVCNDSANLTAELWLSLVITF